MRRDRRSPQPGEESEKRVLAALVVAGVLGIAAVVVAAVMGR